MDTLYIFVVIQVRLGTLLEDTQAMAQQITCIGHQERKDRANTIGKLATRSRETPNETCRVLIKKGPVSVETSLKELEENFEGKSDWKKIDEGGVLAIPDEEFRMINLPQPDQSGKIDFGRRQEGAGKTIEDYPPAQTVGNR